MSKIPNETIRSLQDIMSRGCDYAATQEVVNDIVHEILKELGTEYPYGDEISLFDGDDCFSSVEEFANLFWDKAVECILNVIKTEE